MKITFDVTLSLDKYFKLVNFQNLSLEEQIKKVLFFVTVYSGLRREMAANIISARIRSILNEMSGGKLNKELTQEEVKSAIKKNIPVIENILLSSKDFEQTYREPSEPDYTEGQKVFILNPQAIAELEKEVSEAITGGVSQKLRLAVLCFGLSFLIVFLGGVWLYETTSPAREQLSWAEVAEATHFNQPSTSFEERAAVIVFYITEYIKFNTQMTPEVIRNRIDHLKLPSASGEDARQKIAAAPAVFLQRGGGYVLSKDKIASIEEQLADYHGCSSRVHRFFKNGITHSPGLFLTVTSSLAILLFAIGYYINYRYVFVVSGSQIMLSKENKPKIK